MGVKTDCCNYSLKAEECMGLNETYCRSEGYVCRFYKTREEAAEQIMKCQKRLAKLGALFEKSGRSPDFPKYEPPRADMTAEEIRKDKLRWLNETRRTLEARGLCVLCGKKNDRPGKKTCSACAKAKAKEYIAKKSTQGNTTE